MLITIGPRPANLLFARYRAVVPWRREITLSLIIDKREALPLRVFKRESQSTVALENLTVPHTCFIKALRPPVENFAPVHAQTRTNNTARTSPLSRRPPAEEREVCAWAALRIGVKKVIGAHVVLIYRPFHQSHTERLRCKSDGFLEWRQKSP